jgi:hypothetical protein|tara:strand:- start:7000 stop:7755 length:756 start_codon:yes stop_codon:yes gene_type:complete
VTPSEIKQSIALVLQSDNKPQALLSIFGSTKNMQEQLSIHANSFVEEIVDATAQVFKPFLEKNGEFPDREIMAKLLDDSFEALILHNANSGYFKIEQAKGVIGLINHTEKKCPLAAKYFRYSLSCFLLKLTNAGKQYLVLAILEIAKDSNFLGDILSSAIKTEVKSKNASQAAKKGSAKRWEAKEKTRLYAIELYQSKSYQNANQATDAITENVYDFGKSVGFHFSSVFQAGKTIYKWLLTYQHATNSVNV